MSQDKPPSDFRDLCRAYKLTETEAKASARYLAFLGNEKPLRLLLEVRDEYSKKKKRKRNG